MIRNISLDRSLPLGPQWVFYQERNFVRSLPGDGIVDYIKALFICAKGDGEISQPERDWIVGFAAATGVPDETVQMLDGYQGNDELSAILKANEVLDQSARKALVYDAIRASAADGVLAEGEIARIRTVAKQLGLTEEDTNRLFSVREAVHNAHEAHLVALFGDKMPY